MLTSGLPGFDAVYGDRMLAGLTNVINVMSMDRRGVSVRIKPYEVALALTTLAGRVIALAESANGVVWSDETVDSLRQAVTEERDRQRIGEPAVGAA